MIKTSCDTLINGNAREDLWRALSEWYMSQAWLTVVDVDAVASRTESLT